MLENQTDHILPFRSKQQPAGLNIKGFALLFCVMLFALTGCKPVPAPDSVAKQLMDAINTRQLDVALSLFDGKAVVSVDGMAPFSGKPEVQAWLERLIAAQVKLGEPEVLNQDENSFRAHYSLTTARASGLGVASLEGTGEITTKRGKITLLSFSLSDASTVELQKATARIGAPVLSYAVQTNPDPLRASPGEGYLPNEASLTVVITNDTENPVQVRNITFRLPVGENPGDLASNVSGIASKAPGRWNLNTKVVPFTLKPELPQDGLLEAGQGLVITFSSIKINNQPGVWDLEIVEETGETTRGSMSLQLTKFPFALYVSDLTADELWVEPGGSTTLSWEGSDGATYKLFDGHTLSTVTNVGSYPVDDLTQTTTFYLLVTLVGAEDLPPVIRELTITVLPP